MTPSGGSALSMGYNGDSQVDRVSAGGTTFRYGLLGMARQDTSGSITYYTRDNRGTLVSQRAPGGTYYYLFDGLGSVAALTSSSGAVANTYKYDPDGKVTSSTGTVANPWRFGGAYGAYSDAATGLVKIGHRYYDPGLGRWTQQDPMCGGNRYAYVGGNPVNKTDPSGLMDPQDCANIITFLGAMIGIVGCLALCSWLGAASFGVLGVTCALVCDLIATGYIAFAIQMICYGCDNMLGCSTTQEPVDVATYATGVHHDTSGSTGGTEHHYYHH